VSALFALPASLLTAIALLTVAAVGLATVLVITVTSPNRLEARGLLLPPADPEAGVSLDAIVLPWSGDPSLETR